MSQQIRCTALAIIRRADGKILLEKGYDRRKDAFFYRPLGGGIEFGERSRETLLREFMEELGQHIVVERLLTVLENIFTFDDKPGHEIVFVYAARLANAQDETRDYFQRVDGGDAIVTWVDVKEAGLHIYPEGLLAIIGQ